MKNIAFFPTRYSGVSYYRIRFPVAALQKRGWPVSIHTHLEIDTDNHCIRKPEADAYVFQRWEDESDGYLDLSENLRKVDDVVIADCDDWMLGFGRAFSVRLNLKKSQLQHNIYRSVPYLTVVSETLREQYEPSKGKGRVSVLRNCLDWSMWDKVEKEPRDRLRIGYVGMLADHGHDLALLKGIVGPWLSRNPDVDFVAAGDPGMHDFLGIPEGQRISYPKVQFEDLPSIVQGLDVGLVPLEDHKFNRCKSYLKGLEYAALGIPCIASPMPEYQIWVEPGVNGYLAKRPKEWLRALDTVKDPIILKELSANAREQAYEHRIDARIHEWEDFYSQVIDGLV